MKHWWLIACVCMALNASAQDHSLLYAIKGKGSKTSYLFGTMHMVPDSAFYFPEKLEKTLAKSDELVLEISDMNDQQKALKLMQLKDSSCFRIFSPEQKDSIILWGAATLHMAPKAFEKGFSARKPLMLVQIGTQAMMKGPVKLYELELIGRAAGKKKKISGLETMEYQLSIFDQMPDSTIRDMVLSMMRKTDEPDSTSIKMIQLYRQQDVEGLAKLIAESDEMVGSIDTLLNQRNKNWIPVMSEKMKTSSCFFAVGAGHLGGSEGVIALLRQAGYTVTPISY